ERNVNLVRLGRLDGLKEDVGESIELVPQIKPHEYVSKLKPKVPRFNEPARQESIDSPIQFASIKPRFYRGKLYRTIDAFLPWRHSPGLHYRKLACMGIQ
ncbi:hypothetical protein CHS0354_018222, partial [Potamilus streckersoni]